MSVPGTQYLLTGFTQNTGLRVFVFEGVGVDGVRTPYSVRADLTLARKYGIRMQELPLLCRGVLEQRSESDERRAFTFTEGDMTLHSDLVRSELELHKRKTPRRPPAAAATEPASFIRPA